MNLTSLSSVLHLYGLLGDQLVINSVYYKESRGSYFLGHIPNNATSSIPEENTDRSIKKNV